MKQKYSRVNISASFRKISGIGYLMFCRHNLSLTGPEGHKNEDVQICSHLVTNAPSLFPTLSAATRGAHLLARNLDRVAVQDRAQSLPQSPKRHLGELLQLYAG